MNARAFESQEAEIHGVTEEQTVDRTRRGVRRREIAQRTRGPLDVQTREFALNPLAGI